MDFKKDFSHRGRPHNFSQGGKVDILLIIFRFLTMQCKQTFTKRFSLSTPQRKYPMLRQKSQKSVLCSNSQGSQKNFSQGDQPERYSQLGSHVQSHDNGRVL